jgi:transcriptional regulator with XRE-family HTH domain
MANENYFPKNVRLLLLAYDIPQKQVAKKLGISEATFSRMLTKPEYPAYSIEAIKTIAGLFGADLEKLVSLDLGQELKNRVQKSP